MAVGEPGEGGKNPPKIDTTEALKATEQSLKDSIKAQQDMLALSLQANTAMAYLQMALGVSGKVAGR